LSDVDDNSTIDLNNTTLNCNSASPGKIAETYDGVLHHRPAGGSLGNWQTCAFGGGSNHIREVDVGAAAFEDANGAAISSAAFTEGDFIEVTGNRRGVGGNSTVDATVLKRLGSGQNDKCKNSVTPTPSPSPTPTSTP